MPAAHVELDSDFCSITDLTTFQLFISPCESDSRELLVLGFALPLLFPGLGTSLLRAWVRMLFTPEGSLSLRRVSSSACISS